jgi:hypothetical protein
LTEPFTGDGIANVEPATIEPIRKDHTIRFTLCVEFRI